MKQLKQEFSILLIRVPLLSVISGFIGVITIAHIVTNETFYPKFDKKAVFGVFALLVSLGYCFISILKELFGATASMNFFFTGLHIVLNCVNFLCCSFLLQQMTYVLKLPGFKPRNSENDKFDRIYHEPSS